MTRQIIAIDGPEAGAFLQGLITNDIARADRDGIVYTALLTPQGKYLADFFVIALDGGGYWLDADTAQVAGLMQRLTMYKLRADVTLAPAGIAVARGTAAAPAGALADPRHPALGWRHYGMAGTDDGTDWDALRVAHVIPQAGIELTPNETYILEAGFERLHGVDFRKGCYVGQEVTARMKHKTELRKGLMQVAVQGSAPVGTPITQGEREVGTLFTQSGAAAIAQMRFDRIGPGMTAGDAAICAVPPD